MADVGVKLGVSWPILGDFGLKLGPSWQDVGTKMPKMSQDRPTWAAKGGYKGATSGRYAGARVQKADRARPLEQDF